MGLWNACSNVSERFERGLEGSVEEVVCGGMSMDRMRLFCSWRLLACCCARLWWLSAKALTDCFGGDEGHLMWRKTRKYGDGRRGKKEKGE